MILSRVLVAAVATTLIITAQAALAEPFVYVGVDRGVAVVDGTTNRTIRTHRIGPVGGMALSADGQRLYVGLVTDQPPFEVLELDASGGDVQARFTVPGLAYGLALNPNDGRLWVSHSMQCGESGCAGARGFTVVDPASLAIVASFIDDQAAAFGGPFVIDPSGATAYTTTTSDIVALDTTDFSVIASLPSICCISPVSALHPDGHTFYVLGNEFGGFISIADLRTPNDFARTVFVMGQSQENINFQTDVAFSPDGGRAYLPGGTFGSSGGVFVMNTAEPGAPVLERFAELDVVPGRVALSSDGSRAYLTHPGGGLIVVETESLTEVASISLRSATFAAIAVGPGDVPPMPTPVSGVSDDGCRLAPAARPSWPAGMLLLGPWWLLRRRERQRASLA